MLFALEMTHSLKVATLVASTHFSSSMCHTDHCLRHIGQLFGTKGKKTFCHVKWTKGGFIEDLRKGLYCRERVPEQPNGILD